METFFKIFEDKIYHRILNNKVLRNADILLFHQKHKDCTVSQTKDNSVLYFKNWLYEDTVPNQFAENLTKSSKLS